LVLQVRGNLFYPKKKKFGGSPINRLKKKSQKKNLRKKKSQKKKSQKNLRKIQIIVTVRDVKKLNLEFSSVDSRV
jgi:hypothetical protein